MSDVLTASPKPFVFVLMPFAPEFNDVYALGIKAACDEAGAYCERVDEQIYEERILDRIYNQISKADLIVADMTGRNANVFYEVGYAHGIGQRVILITKDAKDIPFDFLHFPHIIYDKGIAWLKDELKRRVRWFIENPAKAQQYFESNLALYVNKKRLVGNSVIEMKALIGQMPHLRFALDIHNSTEKRIETSNFQLGWILPSRFSLISVSQGLNSNSRFAVKKIQVTDNETLHVVDNYFGVLPGSWEKIYMSCSASGKTEGEERLEDIPTLIKLFSESGVSELSLTIRMNVTKPVSLK